MTSETGALRSSLEARAAELDAAINETNAVIVGCSCEVDKITAVQSIREAISQIKGIKSYSPELIEEQIAELEALLQDARERGESLRRQSEAAKAARDIAQEELEIIKRGLKALDAIQSGALREKVEAIAFKSRKGTP